MYPPFPTPRTTTSYSSQEARGGGQLSDLECDPTIWYGEQGLNLKKGAGGPSDGHSWPRRPWLPPFSGLHWELTPWTLCADYISVTRVRGSD